MRDRGDAFASLINAVTNQYPTNGIGGLGGSEDYFSGDNLRGVLHSVIASSVAGAFTVSILDNDGSLIHSVSTASNLGIASEVNIAFSNGIRVTSTGTGTATFTFSRIP